MKNTIKLLTVVLIIKPIVLLLLGLNIIGRKNLPTEGPAIVVANHNSHLDTLVLLSLFPISKITKVRPVAAADYFLKNKFISWIALNCIGIIPISRQNIHDKQSLFQECHNALDNNEILIIFPEGSRGQPETISQLKKGVYHLVKERHDTQIIPVVLHGLGKALPKGEALLVPFNCDVVIGEALAPSQDANEFINQLSNTFNQLFEFCITKVRTNTSF